jgi:hypothetical protein
MLLNSLEWSSSTRTAAAQVSDYESGKRGRARRIARFARADPVCTTKKRYLAERTQIFKMISIW